MTTEAINVVKKISDDKVEILEVSPEKVLEEQEFKEDYQGKNLGKLETGQTFGI